MDRIAACKRFLMPGHEMGQSYYDFKFYSVSLQVITIILTIILIFFSLDYQITFGTFMTEFTFGTATIFSLIASLLLLFTSVLEEAGIVGDHFITEFICDLLGIFAMIVIFGTGIAFLNYEKFFSNVRENELEHILDLSILTYSLAVFTECCNSDNLVSFACDLEAPIYPCYAYVEDFNRDRSLIDKNVCYTLESYGLVSKTDPESCGNQQIIPFIRNFMDFAISKTKLIGIINTSIGLFLLLLAAIITYMLYFVSRDLSYIDITDEFSPIVADRIKKAMSETGLEPPSKQFDNHEEENKETDGVEETKKVEEEVVEVVIPKENDDNFDKYRVDEGDEEEKKQKENIKEETVKVIDTV